MIEEESVSVLTAVKAAFARLSEEHNLLGSDVAVLVKTLSPEEAIGNPGRRDFPIVMGKERVVEAEFRGAKAHAFTDSPAEFIGKLRDVVALPLAGNSTKAVFIAVMNAVLKYLNVVETTLHCRDEEPEKCARQISSHIQETLKPGTVGLIGLNPAMLEALGLTFGADNVRVTDLNRQNVGTVKCGVNVWDGVTATETLVEESDVVLLTGTTFVNGTFDGIWKVIRHYNKNYLIYGVTSAGVCQLEGLNRICPYGRA